MRIYSCQYWSIERDLTIVVILNLDLVVFLMAHELFKLLFLRFDCFPVLFASIRCPLPKGEWRKVFMQERRVNLIQDIKVGRGLSKYESGPERTAVEIEFEDRLLFGLFGRDMVGADPTVNVLDSFAVMTVWVLEPTHQANEVFFGLGAVEQFKLLFCGVVKALGLLWGELHKGMR